jgi:hypothetical protein
MNRPRYPGTATMRKLTRQKYLFPASSQDTDKLESWGTVIEILCEDLEFHEVLARHDMKVMIGTDWTISFQNTGAKLTGPRLSRVMKALWDSFKGTFEDYGIRLQNTHTGELVG